MDFVRRSRSGSPCCTKGSVLAEGTMDAVQNDARVIEVYLGTA